MAESRLYTPLVAAATERIQTVIGPARRGVYADAPVGQRFGRWTVLGSAERKGGHHRWRVVCDCGREHDRQACSIATGASTQCVRCNAQDVAAARALPVSSKAGGRQRPEYKSWTSMLSRCSDPDNAWWHRYGGRGIRVADRWRSFAAFYEDMGPRPSSRHSLERVDNDGDYAPGNVRWATAIEQARNTRRNRVLEIDGERLCVSAWAERVGCRPQRIFRRLSLGWSPREAVLGRAETACDALESARGDARAETA